MALRNSLPQTPAIASKEVKGQGGGALRIHPAVRQDHVREKCQEIRAAASPAEMRRDILSGQSVSAAPPLDPTAPAEPLEEQKEEKKHSEKVSERSRNKVRTELHLHP